MACLPLRCAVRLPLVRLASCRVVAQAATPQRAVHNHRVLSYHMAKSVRVAGGGCWAGAGPLEVHVLAIICAGCPGLDRGADDSAGSAALDGVRAHRAVTVDKLVRAARVDGLRGASRP